MRHVAVLEYSHGKRHRNVLASRISRKEKSRMNKHFFELPKAVKRAVWAALMAEWVKKKAANRTTG